jgi:hypothetical protein
MSLPMSNIERFRRWEVNVVVRRCGEPRHRLNASRFILAMNRYFNYIAVKRVGNLPVYVLFAIL